MLELLCLINFSFAAFDAWLTRRRLKTYGPNVELNGIIRATAKVLGPEAAVIGPILFIGASQSYLCNFFHLEWVIAMLVGFRLRMFYNQLMSMRFESQAKDIQKLINSKLAGGPQAPSPADAKCVPSQPPASLSEEDKKT
jgi:hypothetical protein